MQRKPLTRLRNGTAAYAAHLGVAGCLIPFGILLLSVMVGVLGLAVIGPLVPREIDFAFSEPYFPVQVLVTGIAGYRIAQKWPSRVAYFLWIIPAILLARDAAGYFHPPMSGGWHAVWDNYFSSDCSDSECLGEVMLTMPLYTTLAYGLGTWLARQRGGRRAQSPL